MIEIITFKAKSVPSPVTRVENDENFEAAMSSPVPQPTQTAAVSLTVELYLLRFQNSLIIHKPIDLSNGR